MSQHRLARHEFGASALPDDTFRVLDFAGEEAVSQLYRFDVNLISGDPDVAFADVVGKPATLTMYRGDEPSEINGIVIDFAQAEMVDGESDFRYRYRAVLAPRLWTLSLSSQSRIYQNLTVQEIVQGILDDAAVDADFNLNGSYAAREFCTQYKETDLNFVQRLLEFEGIRYHFEHKAGKDLLVITDHPAGATDLEAPGALQYRYQGGLMSTDGLEAVEDFTARQQLVTAETEIKDYNYRTPTEKLLSTSEINADLAVGKESDFGIHVMDGGRGDTLATVRNQEIESTRLVMSGHGDCLRFRAGHVFTLEEHYRSAMNQKYMLTRVAHSGSQSGHGDLLGDQEQARDYRNQFTCVPASVEYRPPRLTPEPKLPGVLTAKVESGGGTYAPVDDQGRYRVRMPFDIGSAGAAQASKPVRLAQPYTGPGYGQHFPVHKDVEMVVACVDGNVDRVLGLSTIYNPTQFSPVTSSNAAHNVLRSWGKNELTFDDTQSAEDIFMFATKDHTVEVTNDETTHVGHDRDEQVDNDETLKVGHDRDQTIGHDATLKVGNDQAISIGLNRKIDIGSNLDEDIGGSMTQIVGSSSTEQVMISKTTTVGISYSIEVGAALSQTVGASSAETAGLDKSIQAGEKFTVSAGDAASMTSGKDFDITSSKNLNVQAADNGTISIGKDLSIAAGKKTVIEVGDQLTLKCGKAEIVLKKNGDISIKGKKIDAKGSGNITIKGSKTAIN